MKCRPLRDGSSEVRKANPLISPFTRRWPRTPHVRATSKGISTTTQLGALPNLVSRAENDFAVLFGGIEPSASSHSALPATENSNGTQPKDRPFQPAGS